MQRPNVECTALLSLHQRFQSAMGRSKRMTDKKVRCLTCKTEATWEEWTKIFVRGRRSGNMNCPECLTPIDIKVAGQENWVCADCGRWHDKTVSCEDFA